MFFVGAYGTEDFVAGLLRTRQTVEMPVLGVATALAHELAQPCFHLRCRGRDMVPERVGAVGQGRVWTGEAADIGSKRRTYEHLGVYEYWLFDRRASSCPRPWRATGCGTGTIGR